ncbi:MAG: terminase, partial [Candidatus Gracilibacteria bacterium]
MNKETIKAILDLIEKNPELIKLAESTMKTQLGLAAFIKSAWPFIDGSKYIHNWHIDCISEHLEALFNREIKKLIICIPPRMGKSQICSVCFPAWVWTKDPTQQIYSASYSRELCDRDSWRSRLLISSEWYQSQWGSLFSLATDSNRKNFYHNNKGGYRLSLSTQAGSTGHGYDILIIDDPHKATDVVSRSKREAVIHWYTDAISTRANNNNAVQIVIGQRLHHKDLIGFLIDSSDWEILKLPMEYIPTTYVTKIGWKDPRRYKGELLFPARFNDEDVAKLKLSLKTPANIAAQ